MFKIFGLFNPVSSPDWPAADGEHGGSAGKWEEDKCHLGPKTEFWHENSPRTNGNGFYLLPNIGGTFQSIDDNFGAIFNQARKNLDFGVKGGSLR